MNGTLIALFVMVVLVGAGVFLFARPTGEAGSGLPGFATRHPLIKEAYMFATESPEGLNGVNCYCGCMQHPHSGRIHARGLLDCFRTESGFDRHGSECDMCVNAALDAKKMSLEGKAKDEIKNAIDAKYGG